MNAMPKECLRIVRSRRSGDSLPVDTVPPAQIDPQTNGFPPSDNTPERAATRNSIRGRLIMIAFVAVAPIAIGAWLWLLGRVALALL